MNRWSRVVARLATSSPRNTAMPPLSPSTEKQVASRSHSSTHSSVAAAKPGTRISTLSALPLGSWRLAWTRSSDANRVRSRHACRLSKPGMSGWFRSSSLTQEQCIAKLICCHMNSRVLSGVSRVLPSAALMTASSATGRSACTVSRLVAKA